MIEDLRPLGLTDAARRIGVHPLEVVRRAVAAREPIVPWTFTEARIAALQGAEAPWFDLTNLPTTPIDRVRAALGALVLRGYQGDRRAPLEGIVAGLPAGDQSLIRRVFDALVREGLLTAANGAYSVLPTATDRVSAISTGTSDTPGMRAALVE